MFFWDHLEDYSDRIAVIGEDNAHRTYSELIHTADKLIGTAGSRSVIFLQCENSFASVAAYIGCLRHRVIPVMLNNSLPKERFEELVRAYRPYDIKCGQKAHLRRRQPL